ncbi:MAG: hypothetical protein B6D55_04675 [Candidatus Omnitrophica bacterium 4484_70.2]|nr:MAG: hypothetical protein B6D55_04675 [Candidatus Omnitrophica bacterium 4484_70.2]
MGQLVFKHIYAFKYRNLSANPVRVKTYPELHNKRCWFCKKKFKLNEIVYPIIGLYGDYIGAVCKKCAKPRIKRRIGENLI